MTSIFVNVASYRDPECEPTVRDLLSKAANPQNIHVLIVLQAEPEDNLMFECPNVHIVPVEASDSSGVCWARSLGYRYYNGEEYVLQIDSHTRFAPNWETTLLNQIRQCDSSKPVLTTYPPGYEPPARLSSSDPMFMSATRFDDWGMPVFIGTRAEKRPDRPRIGAGVGACFIFGLGQWVREVPYDPHICFWGEEPTLAARLWTHGWDMFGPTETALWHRWNRGTRRKLWDDRPDEWSAANERSLARMRHLFGMEPAPASSLIDIDRYGLGTFRSLAQFQEFSGIHYKERQIASFAVRGDWSAAYANHHTGTYGNRIT